MTGIRSFMISVVAAAMICAIVKRICPEKNTVSSIIGMFCGLLMAVTVLRPVVTMDLSEPWLEISAYSLEAQQVTAAGKEEADAAFRAHIKEQLEAYVIREATGLQAKITVDIRLGTEAMPKPESITVFGSVSPYAKARLVHLITEELGIPKEAQEWIG